MGYASNRMVEAYEEYMDEHCTGEESPEELKVLELKADKHAEGWFVRDMEQADMQRKAMRGG